MSDKSWLERVWYAAEQPPWWLKPPAALFASVVRLRRGLYSRGLKTGVRLPCAVIVVGNVSVGGTGKTPLVCWLALELKADGRKVGVVLRGYGGSRESPKLLESTDQASEVGDEALLIAHRTGVPVAVGKNRAAAATLLLTAGCDVILADDGLQHYALRRDCEIVVIDGQRGLGNHWQLPAGPLREPAERIEEADAVVVNGASEKAMGFKPPRFTMRLEAHEVERLDGTGRVSLASFAGKRVHAIAGIGNPQRFFDMLSGLGMLVTPHPKPDHAVLKRDDISFADDLPVLMTEKDAVKCVSFAAPNHWVVPVTARFDAAESKGLADIVRGTLDRFTLGEGG
jgi:tetraacyldisaccharide 4'-kinase